MPALAGTARMPYRTFLAWNATGGILWGAVVVPGGYLAGESYHRVEAAFGRDGARPWRGSPSSVWRSGASANTGSIATPARGVAAGRWGRRQGRDRAGAAKGYRHEVPVLLTQEESRQLLGSGDHA